MKMFRPLIWRVPALLLALVFLCSASWAAPHVEGWEDRTVSYEVLDQLLDPTDTVSALIRWGDPGGEELPEAANSIEDPTSAFILVSNYPNGDGKIDHIRWQSSYPNGDALTRRSVESNIDPPGKLI